jgi:hypothetical protein
VTNNAIDIVRAPKASKITSRLNLRIRRSYACAQLISRLSTGVRLAGQIDPLAFTYCFYHTEKPRYSSKSFLSGKQIYRQS